MDLGHFKPFVKKKPTFNKQETRETLDIKVTPMNKRSFNVDIAPSVENSLLKENSLDVTYNIEIEQTPVMQTEEKKISIPISGKVSKPISYRYLNIESQQSFEEINTKIIQREK